MSIVFGPGVPGHRTTEPTVVQRRLGIGQQKYWYSRNYCTQTTWQW